MRASPIAVNIHFLNVVNEASLLVCTVIVVVVVSLWKGSSTVTRTKELAGASLASVYFFLILSYIKTSVRNLSTRRGLCLWLNSTTFFRAAASASRWITLQACKSKVRSFVSSEKHSVRTFF